MLRQIRADAGQPQTHTGGSSSYDLFDPPLPTPIQILCGWISDAQSMGALLASAQAWNGKCGAVHRISRSRQLLDISRVKRGSGRAT